MQTFGDVIARHFSLKSSGTGGWLDDSGCTTCVELSPCRYKFMKSSRSIILNQKQTRLTDYVTCIEFRPPHSGHSGGPTPESNILQQFVCMSVGLHVTNFGRLKSNTTAHMSCEHNISVSVSAINEQQGYTPGSDAFERELRNVLKTKTSRGVSGGYGLVERAVTREASACPWTGAPRAPSSVGTHSTCKSPLLRGDPPEQL